jgi:uncharacterized protein (DUF305 family)
MACSNRPGAAPANPSAEAEKHQPRLKSDEHAFLHLMAEHQELGVSLARQAADQASSTEVQQLGRRLEGEENEDLNKLIGLGAVAPDGRTNPQEHARIPSQPGASGPKVNQPNLVGRTGPGMVPAGGKSFDQRWIQAYVAHQQAGIRLIQDFQSRLTSQPLQLWCSQLMKREQSELAELRSLRVL